jgi:hypothetical protein
MRLTKAMKSQLLEYLHDVLQKNEYWGNSEQFWTRHEKIVEWVEEQDSYSYRTSKQKEGV